MINAETNPMNTKQKHPAPGTDERGAALATAILMLAFLSAIAMTVLAVVQTETRVAGSDLERTQAFYAAASGIEKMTSDFSSLFGRTSRPTITQLNNIAGSPPDLTGEGFTFSQSIALDTARLAQMRATQGITNGAYPHVTIPDGPFAGLTASVAPYNLETTATSAAAQVTLKRDMNNYMIPLFQFGMFSDEDIELHPGPEFTFNGRVHANDNIYVNGNVVFLAKVTAANEFVTDVLRNGSVRTGANVRMKVGAITVSATQGSMVNGPNIPGANVGERGYFPTSPNGTINSSWNTTSVASATVGVPNRFGGQLLTRTTGAAALKLPLQLDGNPTREIIKRRMPNDSVTLSESRYHTKAEIRILIEDEGLTSDVSRIAGSQNGDGTNNAGVNLSTFTPMPLPNAASSSGGGRALWRVPDTGGTTYTDTASTCVLQIAGPSPSPTPAPSQAMTVRGVKAASETVSINGQNVRIPGGSGLTGKILIQIVDPNGVARDVTREILSMGMTVGEPNAIVHLQRPLWAAFTQGSRDATLATGQNHLAFIVNSSYLAADGEIKIGTSNPSMNTTYGYLTAIVDDTTGQPLRAASPPSNAMSNLMLGTPGANWAAWNAIVPINLYNNREGHLKTSVVHNAVYERGITSVIEINMRNLARWMDGVYDQNLLAGTGAVSANIGKPDGYIVYFSDRRGDKVRSMVDSSGATVSSSNGMVDNADIYGPNGSLDPGEDVQGTGTLIKDVTEVPDAALYVTIPTYGTDRIKRAVAVSAWPNTNDYFRRSLRIFNGEDLVLSGAANKLSSTLGITVATENLAYIWGNYNTTGINLPPLLGTSSLNESSAASRYTGDQVPSSIVCDAFFPLSKTWHDAGAAVNPDDYVDREADRGLTLVTQETSVRAGIIAGNNLSALDGTPDAENNNDSRLSGGMHNFPRFLEDWLNDDRRWNFVGSFVPLYRSTQALGPWWYVTNVAGVNRSTYGAPIRNWAFDVTFQQPDRLPPGTPLFQFIQPTAFRLDL